LSWSRSYSQELAPGKRAAGSDPQTGVGTGYLTAVLAEQVGRRGRITAFEVDADLAARARRNLRPWCALGLQVRVLHGDALGRPFDAAGGITVNAGATHPPAAWLDALAPGGRLLLPLTTDEGWRRFDAAQIARRGAVLLIARNGCGTLARWLSPVAIYPCAGARTPDADAALRRAFKRGGGPVELGLARSSDTIATCRLPALLRPTGSADLSRLSG
jgi:protein-L-isoaspartate(D-aspartate) O-methyltransferase